MKDHLLYLGMEKGNDEKSLPKGWKSFGIIPDYPYLKEVNENIIITSKFFYCISSGLTPGFA
jgi:hypothetical protein